MRKLGVSLFLTTALLCTLSTSDARADEPTPFNGSSSSSSSSTDDPAAAEPRDDFRAAGTSGRKRNYEVRRSWYGYQTLSADAFSIGLMSLGLVADGKTAGTGLVTTGLISYVLTAPIVHFVHDHPGKGAGDLGLRIGAPMALGLIGALIGGAVARPQVTSGESGLDRAADDFAQLDTILLGSLIGMIVGATTAIVIDGAVIAREDVRVEKDRRNDSAKASEPRPQQQRQQHVVSFVPTVRPVAGGASAGVAGIF